MRWSGQFAREREKRAWSRTFAAAFAKPPLLACCVGIVCGIVWPSPQPGAVLRLLGPLYPLGAVKFASRPETWTPENALRLQFRKVCIIFAQPGQSNQKHSLRGRAAQAAPRARFWFAALACNCICAGRRGNCFFPLSLSLYSAFMYFMIRQNGWLWLQPAS